MRDVEVIRLGHPNTVRSLIDQLQALLSTGNDDGGFPILRKDGEDHDNWRMVGYIGANELEHALSKNFFPFIPFRKLTFARYRCG